MSRIIKFRVWDTKNKKWISNTSIHCESGVIIAPLKTPFNIELDSNPICQQFTGLKDINNKDIYEGDIIKVSELDSNQQAGMGKRRILQTFEKAIVTWNDRLAFYYNPIRKVGASIPHQMLSYGYKPEIIGNIFENKK